MSFDINLEPLIPKLLVAVSHWAKNANFADTGPGQISFNEFTIDLYDHVPALRQALVPYFKRFAQQMKLAIESPLAYARTYPRARGSVRTIASKLMEHYQAIKQRPDLSNQIPEFKELERGKSNTEAETLLDLSDDEFTSRLAEALSYVSQWLKDMPSPQNSLEQLRRRHEIEKPQIDTDRWRDRRRRRQVLAFIQLTLIDRHPLVIARSHQLKAKIAIPQLMKVFYANPRLKALMSRDFDYRPLAPGGHPKPASRGHPKPANNFC